MVLGHVLPHLLIESGHSYSSIILCTGHFNTTTLSRYHNLHGAGGLRQHQNLFWPTVREGVYPHTEQPNYKKPNLWDTEKRCSNVREGYARCSRSVRTGAGCWISRRRTNSIRSFIIMFRTCTFIHTFCTVILSE